MPTSPRRTVLWVVAAALAALLYGPAYLAVVRPPPGFVGDFVQDWLSARDHDAGLPVYGDLRAALFRHTGLIPDPRDEFLAVNAHPPASVLLVLPLAPLGPAEAHFVWNLVTLPLAGLAVWLVVRELGCRPGWRGVVVAVALGLPCAPLFDQVMFGQFNALLVFLLAAAWAADRRGLPWLAGACVGVAAAVKLFPAFVALYFVAAGRWRAVAATVIAFVGVNAAAAGVLGSETFRVYVAEVVPAVSGEFAGVWRNLSAESYWLRALAPPPQSRIDPAPSFPVLARALIVASQLAVVGAVAWTAWAGRATTTGRDRAYAAACAGMLLLAPTSWPHYFLLLAVPVGLLVARLPAGPGRWAMWACLAVAWLSDTQAAKLVLGPERAFAMIKNRHDPLTPAENLLVASLQTYALAGLFALTLRLPRDPPPS
ncbi:MAG: glycosyltransferase family 87 protein [Gemmataceae bacterium]